VQELSCQFLNNVPWRSTHYFYNRGSTTLSLPVKVFSEGTTNAIESDWVDAAVGISKTETQDAKVMPKGVIIFFRSWMKIKP
jgi:hypothetical protein